MAVVPPKYFSIIVSFGKEKNQEVRNKISSFFKRIIYRKELEVWHTDLVEAEAVDEDDKKWMSLDGNLGRTSSKEGEKGPKGAINHYIKVLYWMYLPSVQSEKNYGNRKEKQRKESFRKACNEFVEDLLVEFLGQTLQEAYQWILEEEKKSKSSESSQTSSATEEQAVQSASVAAAIIPNQNPAHVNDTPTPKTTSNQPDLPWGVGVSSPESIAPLLYSVEMTDLRQKPNEEPGVPVHLRVAMKSNDHLREGYEFGFSKVAVRVTNINPEIASMELNYDDWRTGRHVDGAIARVSGGNYDCFVELSAVDSLGVLNDQFHLTEKRILTFKSSQTDDPLPMLDSTLTAHIANMKLLECPDGIKNNQIKRELAKRLIHKSKVAELHHGPDNEEPDDDEEIVFSCHKATVNCG